MKRHPSLEAFSRDHNVGLIFGRRLVQASSLDEGGRQAAVGELLQYWSDELADHFMEEERLLLSLIPSAELRHRLVEDHREFSAIVDYLVDRRGDPDLMGRAGELLAIHIRWEERVLFPEIQRTATTRQLEELSDQTRLVEDRRSNSPWSPRRGELVRRRKAGHLSDSSRDRAERLAIERWETEGGRLVAV
ncbi:MAG TPA: hemerythrin domain-containing protein [Fimbriimonadaceae bacterium]|nr:hemerythrin domain-containing protein [Fimbriimonadaceae bacterium]